MSDNSGRPSFWKRLWTPSGKWYLLWLPAGGILSFLVGVLFLGVFNFTIHATNENWFCYSCHVGMDTIVEEYESSTHFTNRKGVAASCADCHIPKEFVPKMIVKTKAIADIYYQMIGTINLENFESERLRLAQPIWDEMQANGSRECKSCHNPEIWDRMAQPARARTSHDPNMWEQRSQSCIDCHYGIAHKRPTIQ